MRRPHSLRPSYAIYHWGMKLHTAMQRLAFRVWCIEDRLKRVLGI